MTTIMTDTNSGIAVAEGAEHGIIVLPMPVIVNGLSRTEGVDITHEDLYKAMDEGLPVSTSQPSPGDVTGMWDRLLSEGAEEIVYIPMSSGLSASCASASALAKDYGGKVFVVDNHRISVTQRASVFDALDLARQGESGWEIKKRLESSGFDASIYLCVNTLKYLKQGSRVTAAGASLATALDFHPVLNIRGGKLDAQCVVRGERHMHKTLIRLMETDLEKRFRYIPPERISLYTAGTFPKAEDAEAWNAKVQKAFPKYHVTAHPLSCSIACHVGSNSVAIAMAIREDTGSKLE